MIFWLLYLQSSYNGYTIYVAKWSRCAHITWYGSPLLIDQLNIAIGKKRNFPRGCFLNNILGLYKKLVYVLGDLTLKFSYIAYIHIFLIQNFRDVIAQQILLLY